MKKRILFLVMSLCILMLAGGCGKKDVASELDETNTEATATTAPTGAAEDTAAEEAPVKEAYEVSDYITLGEYKGIEVTVEQLEVTDADVETQIESELTANTTQEEVTGRAVQDKDIVNIDYEGLIDGVAFDGGTAQGTDLTIGSGRFIEGFESGLIGKNIGDKVKLELTFAADYSTADLAGKAVVFNVTINAIKQSVVPELTAAYVTENTDYDTIDAYKAGVRADLEAANAETMKSDKINSVLTAIIEKATISSYPETLMNYYSYEMKSYYTQYASMYGMEFADFLASSGMTEESFATESQTYAESRASQELVLNAIIKAENMELTEDEYSEGVAGYVTEYGYASEEELLQAATEDQIKESLLWDKVITFITDQAVEL